MKSLLYMHSSYPFVKQHFGASTNVKYCWTVIIIITAIILIVSIVVVVVFTLSIIIVYLCWWSLALDFQFKIKIFSSFPLAAVCRCPVTEIPVANLSLESRCWWFSSKWLIALACMNNISRQRNYKEGRKKQFEQCLFMWSPLQLTYSENYSHSIIGLRMCLPCWRLAVGHLP